MLWGGLSDRLGPLRTFRVMLASQIVVFAFLSFTGDPWLFAVAVCYVLLCYGGGFRTMPAFVLDEFGPRRMAVVYGAILTAWSAGELSGRRSSRTLRTIAGRTLPATVSPPRAGSSPWACVLAPAADAREGRCPLIHPLERVWKGSLG